MSMLQEYLDQWKTPSKKVLKKTSLGQYMLDYIDAEPWHITVSGGGLKDDDVRQIFEEEMEKRTAAKEKPKPKAEAFDDDSYKEMKTAVEESTPEKPKITKQKLKKQPTVEEEILEVAEDVGTPPPTRSNTNKPEVYREDLAPVMIARNKYTPIKVDIKTKPTITSDRSGYVFDTSPPTEFELKAFSDTLNVPKKYYSLEGLKTNVYGYIISARKMQRLLQV